MCCCFFSLFVSRNVYIFRDRVTALYSIKRRLWSTASICSYASNLYKVFICMGMCAMATRACLAHSSVHIPLWTATIAIILIIKVRGAYQKAKCACSMKVSARAKTQYTLSSICKRHTRAPWKLTTMTISKTTTTATTTLFFRFACSL